MEKRTPKTDYRLERDSQEKIQIGNYTLVLTGNSPLKFRRINHPKIDYMGDSQVVLEIIEHPYEKSSGSKNGELDLDNRPVHYIVVRESSLLNKFTEEDGKYLINHSGFEQILRDYQNSANQDPRVQTVREFQENMKTRRHNASEESSTLEDMNKINWEDVKED